MRITFLGTGDSMGTPRTYCDCAVCREARTTCLNRRTRSSLWLEEDRNDLLLDCGPDWRKQMERMGIRRVRSALLTHAHYDHIGGLPEWTDACRYTGAQGKVYAPREVLDVVRAQFPWLERQLDYSENDSGMSWEGWRIRPWKVCHGKNGYSYGYLFTSNHAKWAYVSDAINLQEDEIEPLRELDLLILGTSFVREDAAFHSRSVYDMQEALSLIAGIKPGRVLFTHMSHGVDLRAPLDLPHGVEPAKDGMVITV